MYSEIPLKIGKKVGIHFYENILSQIILCLILCYNTTLFWRVAAADLGIVLSQQNQIKRLRGAAELPSMQAANIKRE